MINKFHLANLDSTVFVFGHIQLILMLILPISMHLVLGGLARSNASCVMSWCIIAPAGAIFYCQGPTGNSRRSLETATKPSPALACFLPSVFMDMHVSIAVTAYVAASATIIACEPFLPAVQLPPLLLRQIFGALNLAGPPAILLIVALALHSESRGRRLAVLHSQRLADADCRASQALVESLLPAFVAAALEGLPPHAWNARPVDHFERCTLVQCDLVGFTRLSTTMSALRAVRLLNDVFSRVEAAAARLGSVWKVELIGDCYFAATGGPAGDGNHADIAARLGMAMIAAVRDVAEVYGVELQVRVGLHTGPVSAAVIGLRFPR